ncbi:MAG: acyltransferase family protein [Porticoccaceae bacterium]
MISYQRHIDGLRALAVLAVVGDHLGFNIIRGGYAGVDVFFVISGYLITGIIARDIDAGSFSFREFYVRRIRRIVPPLVAMVAALLITAYVIMLPAEFINLGKAALAAVLSVSNIWFWKSQGYFDVTAHEQPLLHTWSLGVEEQFYLLWPIALVGLWNLSKRRAWLRPSTTTFVAMIGLLLLAGFLVKVSETFSFYMLPTRAWELLAGATIALWRATAWWKRAARPSLLFVAGVALIILPMLTYKHDTEFPGFSALPVVVGTGLLILLHNHPASWASRLLGSYIPSFFGRISYSLYLWHWPLIVLQQQHRLIPLPDMGLGRGSLFFERGVLFVLMIGLAYASYRYVEGPFRKRWTLAPLAGGAVLVTASLVVIVTGGLAYRFPAGVLNYDKYLSYDKSAQFRTGVCFDEEAQVFIYKSECFEFATDRPNVLVLGDSYAAHLWYGLHQHPVHVAQATAAGCRPLMDKTSKSAPGCTEMVDYVYQKFLVDNKPDLLIIAGRWTEADVGEIRPSLQRLKELQINTLLVGPTVEYDGALPQLLAWAAMGDKGIVERKLVLSRFALDQKMAVIAGQNGVPYFSIIALLCGNTLKCQQVIGSAPLAFDVGHFTPEGSQLIASQLLTHLAK